VTDVWKLYAGDELVADLVVTATDFPWLEARVEAQPALERYRELFDAEWAASDAGDWDVADKHYYEIRRALRLANPDGEDTAEFLLHIDGHKAWWRWADEPFDEP
jgi:hypothetical protein